MSDNQLIVTDTTANSSQPLFVLRPDIHMRNDRYVLGKDINRQILEAATFSASSNMLSKRQLHRCATECLKTIKILISFALALVDGEGNSKKSGQSKEDVVHEVKDFMYDKLNGKVLVDKDDS